MRWTTWIRRLLLASVATGLVAAGCGKDSYLPESTVPIAQIEFGDGIEVVTPSETLVRRFADYTPVTLDGRPALPLRELIGTDAVVFPDLYGYRFMGTDGFYANMPGKGYGDNTWSQLGIGHLDLVALRVVFETERDPMLRKGHNVKYLIRVELLRSIEVAWNDGRKLAPIVEVVPDTVPAGFPAAGTPGLALSEIIRHAIPGDLSPPEHLYRVVAQDGSTLPRLLTWEESHAAFYLPASDRVVMSESLGPAYQVSLPRAIRVEETVRRPGAQAGGR